ncbi:hypothetical protein NXY31_11625 [Bacteroides salyersiae]|nr:hypothetical protein [Bacteroides salyersiae]
MEGMFVRKITVALFAAMLTVTTLGKETGKEGSTVGWFGRKNLLNGGNMLL